MTNRDNATRPSLDYAGLEKTKGSRTRAHPLRRASVAPVFPQHTMPPKQEEPPAAEEEELPPCEWAGDLEEGYPVRTVRGVMNPSPRIVGLFWALLGGAVARAGQPCAAFPKSASAWDPRAP
jgi:hypothetical protein